MGTKNSVISKNSGPQRNELSYAPSQLVLVCDSREETDPEILALADEGFLTLKFNPKHFAFDERAGTVLPTEDELWGYQEVGQIEPGAVQIDGGEYPVVVGRKRLKGMAILNRRASEEAGKFQEPFLFRFITVRGTEQQAFVRQILENEHRTADRPTVKAAKMLRAKTLFGWDDAYIGRLFKVSAAQVAITLGLNDLSAEGRAFVDAGFPSALASRKLTKFRREDQPAVIAKLQVHGAVRGAAAEVALDALLAGGDLGEALSVSSEDSAAAPEDADDASGGPEAGGEAPKRRGKRGAAPEKAKVMRAPSKPALARWCDKLKVAAQPLSDFKVPDKYQPAIEAARAEGARLMAARFLGKTLAGWKSIRDIVEAEEAEEA